VIGSVAASSAAQEASTKAVIRHPAMRARKKWVFMVLPLASSNRVYSRQHLYQEPTTWRTLDTGEPARPPILVES
jgi:hypothetical protein